jgi:hypothetical protein
MGGTDMPEKMTEEEAQISRAIRLVRKAKEVLQEEGRETLPLEIEDPDVKTKKPKAEKDDTKIENNTGTHSGYGLAGETFGKAVDPKESVSITKTIQGIKGLRTQTALDWLRKAGKEKLTTAQVKSIEREVAKLAKVPKDVIYTKLALSDALGVPLDP